MDIRNRQELKRSAADAISLSGNSATRLALIYSGLYALLTLALTAISYLLDLQMESATGLAGLTTRSLLSSAQSMLDIASTLIVPFWQIGFLFIALGIARKEAMQPTSLLEGFRRFGPVLRLTVYKFLLILVPVVLCVYASVLIFSFLPAAEPMIELTETAYQRAVAEGLNEIVFTDAEMQALTRHTIPVFPIFGLLSLVLVLPVVYRYRMAEYALLDAPEKGARAATLTSRILMRGNRMDLLKLDLSFWWYYGASMLVLLVSYGDTILQQLGIPLPLNSTLCSFGFLILHLILQVALNVWALPQIEVTYASAYLQLRKDPPQEENPTSTTDSL